MKVKEKSEKAGLKLNIQNTKIMASSPITSWQTDGEIVETVRDFILGGSKITADLDCSHEIKRCLLLGRKVLTNLDSILKSRDIKFANQGPSSQSCGFSSSYVWVWELDYKESWAPKNWCFWTVVLEKSLGLQGDPTSQSKRKSFLNIHWKDWCWSWNSDTLATWCEEPTHWKRPWCWERLKAGGEGDNRGWDGWMASLTWWSWVWVISRSWWWTGKPGVLQSMWSQRVRHNWVTELTDSLSWRI